MATNTTTNISSIESYLIETKSNLPTMDNSLEDFEMSEWINPSSPDLVNFNSSDDSFENFKEIHFPELSEHKLIDNKYNSFANDFTEYMNQNSQQNQETQTIDQLKCIAPSNFIKTSYGNNFQSTDAIHTIAEALVDEICNIDKQKEKVDIYSANAKHNIFNPQDIFSNDDIFNIIENKVTYPTDMDILLSTEIGLDQQVLFDDDFNNEFKILETNDLISSAIDSSTNLKQNEPDIIKEEHTFETKSKSQKEIQKTQTCGHFTIVDSTFVSFNDKPDEQVACLSCQKIEYNNYTGHIYKKCTDPRYLINSTKASDNIKFKTPQRLIQSRREIANVSCAHSRIRYYRTIEAIKNAITNIIYIPNADFGSKNPYEPQYVRVELNEKGARIHESNSGLCPYCKEVKFLPYKNSSYLSHLTLEHGVFASSYLVPEGLNYGIYTQNDIQSSNCSNQKKVKYNSNTKDKSAIACPLCGALSEANCWSTKSNPLLKYYRHFKQVHANDASDTSRIVDQYAPLRKRGRKINQRSEDFSCQDQPCISWLNNTQEDKIDHDMINNYLYSHQHLNLSKNLTY